MFIPPQCLHVRRESDKWYQVPLDLDHSICICVLSANRLSKLSLITLIWGTSTLKTIVARFSYLFLPQRSSYISVECVPQYPLTSTTTAVHMFCVLPALVFPSRKWRPCCRGWSPAARSRRSKGRWTSNVCFKGEDLAPASTKLVTIYHFIPKYGDLLYMNI